MLQYLYISSVTTLMWGKGYYYDLHQLMVKGN